MTNLPVTQADREAAADLIEQYWQGAGEQHDQMRKTAESYRNGHSQGVWAVAFARHRQSHSTAGAVDTDDLLDLIDEAIGESGDEEWTPRDAARHVIGALEHAGFVVTPRAALTPSALSGDAGEVNRIVRIRVTSMHESCNRTTFYVELTTDEGFTMTPCGHATGSDYTNGKGLSIEEARDRAVTDAGTWGDFLRITPDPLIVDGVEIKPRVPMDLYTTRRVLAERRAALPSHQGAE